MDLSRNNHALDSTEGSGNLVIILACFAGFFSEILVSASRLNLGEHMVIPVILAMAGRPRSFMGMAVLIINLRFVVVGRFLAVR